MRLVHFQHLCALLFLWSLSALAQYLLPAPWTWLAGALVGSIVALLVSVQLERRRPRVTVTRSTITPDEYRKRVGLN